MAHPRLRRTSPITQYAIAAALEALGDDVAQVSRGSVRLGIVIDFILLHAGQYHWPTFNVADASITIGAVLLAYDLIIVGRKKPAVTAN